MYDSLRYSPDGLPSVLSVNLRRSSVLFYPASRRVGTPLYLSFSLAEGLPSSSPAYDATLSLAGPSGRSVCQKLKVLALHDVDVMPEPLSCRGRI